MAEDDVELLVTRRAAPSFTSPLLLPILKSAVGATVTSAEGLDFEHPAKMLNEMAAINIDFMFV